MVKLVFSANREILQFYIRDKVIYYTDRKWKNWIQCIPKDKELVKKILLSRNKVPKVIARLFNLSKAEEEEYKKAKDDNELAEIITLDCKRQGVILQSRKDA
tara:strand:- start:969 stop:1274 length:306 start_codon:yes stop_codon:yes gene_type:complete